MNENQAIVTLTARVAMVSQVQATRDRRAASVLAARFRGVGGMRLGGIRWWFGPHDDKAVSQAESSAGALGGEVAQLLNSCSVEFLQHSH
jgi:hypothetical protein